VRREMRMRAERSAWGMKRKLLGPKDRYGSLASTSVASRGIRAGTKDYDVGVHVSVAASSTFQASTVRRIIISHENPQHYAVHLDIIPSNAKVIS